MRKVLFLIRFVPVVQFVLQLNVGLVLQIVEHQLWTGHACILLCYYATSFCAKFHL